MKALVTGGAGFLGSHLCDQLIQDGHEVWCLDNFVTSNIYNLHGEVNLIIDSVDGTSILPEVDWLFHLASPAAPGDINKFVGTCSSANIDGTKRMLEHANACNAKFLYTSTMKVYGQCFRVEEYITSKCMGESLAEGEKIARLANAYGPKMREDDSRVVPVFINRAIRNEPISLWNGGEQYDSFCYVSDIIRGLLMFMESDETGVIEFGYHHPIMIKDLARKILSLTGSKSPVMTNEVIHVEDECHKIANLKRAINDLGWIPVVHLDDGLVKTITYFEERLHVGKDS